MRKFITGVAIAALLAALVALFYNAVLFQGLILGDYDAFVYFYPLREYAANSLKQGRFPLWNPYLFLGSPFFANVQTAVLYPLNALFLVLSTPYAYTASIVAHVFLAGLGMYLFSRRTLGVASLPAVIGSVTFMFSGFFSGQVGHINQLNVSAWLPLLLVTFDEAVRQRSLILGIAVGLIGSLQLLAGHTQEWYFSTVTLGLFALWRMLMPALPKEPGGRVKELTRRIKPIFYLTIAGLVEIGLTAVQLLPTLELSRYSIRGGGMAFHEATSFSLPPTTLLYTLLSTYPSEIFSEFAGYVGIAPLVLAILATVAWMARPITAFMVGLVAFGLFMALGRFNPIYPFIFDLVPGLDLFRVPARWLLVYTFGVSGLAALGAQLAHDLGWRRERVQRSWREKAPRLLGFLAGNLVIGLGVFVFYFAYQWATPQPTYDDVEAWAVLAALTLAMVALASLGRRVGWVSLSVILLITTGELWIAGEQNSIRHPIPYEAYMPERTSTSFLLQNMEKQGSPGRLLTFATDRYEVKETPDYRRDYWWLHPDALVQFMVNIKLNEVLASNIPLEYGIEAVDGYDGGVLPLKRYADFKSLMMPQSGIPADNQLRPHLSYAPPAHFLDLMNVRYLLSGRIQDAQIDNVYYDRAISIVLNSEESVSLKRMPDKATTSIGLISSTEGARERDDGVVAAVLQVTDDKGATYSIPIRMGMETAETPENDSTSAPPSHSRPKLVESWTPEEMSTEYFAKIFLPSRIQAKEITVRNLLPDAKVRIRAITLIDDVARDFFPLVLSDRFDREMFFDMKLYTNRDLLPRAYVVPRTVIRDDERALEMMREPEMPMDQLAVLSPSPTARTLYRPSEVRYEPCEARIRSYSPEEIVVDVTAGQESYLILSDVYYPGWKATVDGVEVPIERANYLFRGVLVDEGSHNVVFRYEPKSFQIGSIISLASLSLVCVTLLLSGLTWLLQRD
ncbi:MAG: YfhO family protein [Chloroflexota bacterium]